MKHAGDRHSLQWQWLGPLTAIIALLALSRSNAPAQAQDRPRLDTNETYIEDVTRPSALAIDDVMSVLAYVLERLPGRVKVYPTENFYYFRFVHNGVPFAGNIRLDPRDRDSGKVHFVYYSDLTEWGEIRPTSMGGLLDASKGVDVVALERLVYRVTYRDKSVVFILNDLSQVKPPAETLAPDETFLGAIFDESAIRFFLVYNRKLKVFHYVLDETERVPDQLIPGQRTDRILFGRRTGFAFYRDHRRDRRILIGVFEANRRTNNYHDGPFDQLPENFIEGEALREAIIDSDPGVRGMIDRLGHYQDGSARYAISPYMHYYTEDDLHLFHRCATNGKVPSAAYYKCFSEEGARTLLVAANMRTAKARRR